MQQDGHRKAKTKTYVLVKVEALPERSQVYIMLVNGAALKRDLLPAPVTSLAALHKLLPAMAADLFQEFSHKVHSATSRCGPFRGRVIIGSW